MKRRADANVAVPDLFAVILETKEPFQPALGELRKLGEAGELQSKRVFDAVLRAAPALQREFGLIAPTVNQALTTVNNFAQVVVGSFNEAAGITEGLVQIFALTDDTTVSLAQSVREAATAFRTFVEVGTVATVTFADQVAARFNIIEAAIAGTVGEIINSEALIERAIAVRLGQEARLAESKKRFDEETEAIRLNSEARLAAIQARLADLSAKRGGGGGEVEDPKAAAEAQKLVDAQTQLLESLRQQEAALAIVSDTGREYSDVLLELKINTLAAQNGNEAFRFDATETAEEIARLTAEIQANADAEQEKKDRQDEANEITLEARDAAQVYADEVARLQGFLDEGLITPEVFEASVENLKNLDDATQDFFRRARENSQDILAGFLENGLQDLDDFANQFATMLLKLSSQALAAEIFKKIFGTAQDAGGGGGTAGLITGILSIFGRQFGGGVQGGQAVTTGEGGRFGAEVFVPNTGGQVVPTGGDRGAPAAPAVNVPVSIVNTFDDADVVGAFQTGGGDQVVLNMVSKRRQAFRQALGV